MITHNSLYLRINVKSIQNPLFNKTDINQKIHFHRQLQTSIDRPRSIEAHICIKQTEGKKYIDKKQIQFIVD